MPRIKRAIINPHFVAVDTNVLWHKDKDIVVSPDFEAFWDQHVQKYDLNLVIPETVRGELLFQQTNSALNALRKATDSLTEAAKIGGAKYTHRITDARIRRDVAKRLDAWLKRRRAVVAPVPFATVDWPAISLAAVARTGPFATNAKTPDDGKGFRDALILESVLGHCSVLRGNTKLAFISNDGVLRAATEKRIENIHSASAFESLNDFASFLRLSDEKLTRQFAVAIQSRVRMRFFKIDDPASLFNDQKLADRIKKEHPDAFTWFGPTALSSPALNLGSSLLAGATRNPWTSGSNETIWIFNPEFLRLSGTNDYEWKSRIHWFQLFRRERRSTLLATTLGSEEMLRTLRFEVTFSTAVRANGRIDRIEITGISAGEKTFSPPTEEEVRQRGLDRLPNTTTTSE